jgi:predicted  nucleic acid-binding Zn-ribbon protein
MKTFWQLPKAERNTIIRKKFELQKEICRLDGEIAHLEPWLSNIRKMRDDAEKKMAEFNKYI